MDEKKPLGSGKGLVTADENYRINSWQSETDRWRKRK